MIDVLLFDLGGVLIHFAGFEEMRGLVPGRPEMSTIRERWIGSDTVHVFERGDIGAEEFAGRLISEWGLELQPEVFLSEFASWARGPYEGAIDLLAAVREKFKIACLSNSNELHTSIHRDAIGQHIDHQFFSNEIGLTKPGPEIFDFAIRSLGIPAGRIAFFDDTVVNVEAAARAGMNAYLTDGIDELRHCLERLGIVVS